jgi:hypothetical protein
MCVQGAVNFIVPHIYFLKAFCCRNVEPLAAEKLNPKFWWSLTLTASKNVSTEKKTFGVDVVQPDAAAK